MNVLRVGKLHFLLDTMLTLVWWFWALWDIPSRVCCI